MIDEFPKDMITGGGGGTPGDEAPPAGVTMNERGHYVNSFGDFTTGPEGLGTLGKVRGNNVYNEDEEAYQWFLESGSESGSAYAHGRYYRLDENGEKVYWSLPSGYSPKGRYPGDKSFFSREWDTRFTSDREGWRPYRDGMGIRYNSQASAEEDRGPWVSGDDVQASVDHLGEKYGWEYDSENHRYLPPKGPGWGRGNAIRYEVGYFMSWYQATHDGDRPLWSEIEEHLLDTGYVKAIEEEEED